MNEPVDLIISAQEFQQNVVEMVAGVGFAMVVVAVIGMTVFIVMNSIGRN